MRVYETIRSTGVPRVPRFDPFGGPRAIRHQRLRDYSVPSAFQIAVTREFEVQVLGRAHTGIISSKYNALKLAFY
jgi:hypothetical protein